MLVVSADLSIILMAVMSVVQNQQYHRVAASLSRALRPLCASGVCGDVCRSPVDSYASGVCEDLCRSPVDLPDLPCFHMYVIMLQAFAEISDDARSVIVTSGTLSPMNTF